MRALVLSGGGPLAVAWHSGLLAGLARGGIGLGDADFILGTSAGAIVGSQLACGVEPDALANAILAEGAHSRSGAGAMFSSAAAARLPSLFALALGPSEDPAAARREVGAHALAAPTESEEAFVARMAALLAVSAWPGREFGCVAVDALDGAVTLLTRGCGAPLAKAVAASCSLPGISPPVTIGGHPLIDGGFASSANADRAAGYGKVLVAAFRPPGPAGERMAARLERQVAALREAGASILIVAPDEGSSAAIGSQTMDVTHRPDVARAAIVQGRIESPRIGDFWRG